MNAKEKKGRSEKVLGTVDTPYGRAVIHCTTYLCGGAPGIRLEDETEGENIATLSCNLPEHNHQLGEGEFFVKAWSENAPLLPSLLATGLFEETGRSVPTGFVLAPIWRVR